MRKRFRGITSRRMAKVTLAEWLPAPSERKSFFVLLHFSLALALAMKMVRVVEQGFWKETKSCWPLRLDSAAAMQALKSFTSGGADTSSNKQGGGDMQSKVRFFFIPLPANLATSSLLSKSLLNRKLTNATRLWVWPCLKLPSFLTLLEATSKATSRTLSPLLVRSSWRWCSRVRFPA